MPSYLRKCEICREWIPEERVKANPRSNLCIKHAEEIVRYGGEFRTEVTAKSTAKGGTMKHNQNDVTTRMIPNREAIEKLQRDYVEEQFGGQRQQSERPE